MGRRSGGPTCRHRDNDKSSDHQRQHQSPGKPFSAGQRADSANPQYLGGHPILQQSTPDEALTYSSGALYGNLVPAPSNWPQPVHLVVVSSYPTHSPTPSAANSAP